MREGGVLKWVNASGRKVPVSAPAPGECRRCKADSPETTAPKHRHFQCPHWALLDDPAGGGWGGWRAAFCSRAVPAAVAPEVASGFVASFAGLASAWGRLAKSDERAYPRVAAMNSWKQRTRQRYESAIHQLAEFEACIPARPLPEILSLCMAERAADGHSASGLRGLAFAVRAAEDLALVPRVVAALHWRIAKSGRGPGPQAYVSPRALVHIWNAAIAPDDRAVAALAALSWTTWLRVGEAASIRCCDLDRKEGLWFYSTKVEEPGWVCQPAAASSESTTKLRGSSLKSPFSREGPPSSGTPSAACSATPSGLMLAGMPAEGEVPRHAGYASPPPSISSSGGGGLACVPPWVTPWDFEMRRWWAICCCRMLTRLWVWAHAVRCYLRLCGVWLCTTSHGLQSLQWTRRSRAHRLFLGLLEVLWWRTFGKSMASVPLQSTAPSRAHPQPSQDLHRSHDQLPFPRPAPSPLLLGFPLKSSSCPTLTRMRMLEMERGFVELRSVCRTWGASLLRRMSSGLARPVLGGWGHTNDRGMRDHSDSSTRPPLPLSGSTVCLPRPGWVAPMRLPRPFGRSALYPGGGVARLRSVRPVSGPRLVRVLPPVVGFPPPPVGAGRGGVGAQSS